MTGFMNRPAPYDARDRFGGPNRFRNMGGGGGGGGGPNGMGRNFRGTTTTTTTRVGARMFDRQQKVFYLIYSFQMTDLGRTADSTTIISAVVSGVASDPWVDSVVVISAETAVCSTDSTT